MLMGEESKIQTLLCCYSLSHPFTYHSPGFRKLSETNKITSIYSSGKVYDVKTVSITNIFV